MSSIESVCSSEQVAQAFGAAGIQLAGSGRLQLERAWPNRKGGVSACYRAEDGLWSVHGPADPPRDARLALREGRAVCLKELGSWAHRFPFDPLLPHLSEQVDRKLERERPTSAPAAAAATAPFVVSYKPLRRCVLRIGDDRFVKLFRPRAVGEIAAIYGSLASVPDFGAMAVALPESVDERRGAIVWLRSPGRPLLEGREPGRVVEAIERVGLGLGRLQRARLAWGRPHAASDELTALDGWVGVTAEAFPSIARALRVTAKEIAEAVPSDSEERFVPAHRDFHDGQLLADGERVTLLDLDTACMAAPELDPANFLAHLRLRELQCSSFARERAAQSFLEAWAESTASLDPSLLRWYEAAALIRLACVYAFRPQWARLSDGLMSASLSRLKDNSPT